MNREELLHVAAALAIGGALWFVVNLDPVWPVAWFVPGLLFALALKTEGWTSRGLVAIASLVGAASNYRYMLTVFPLTSAMLVLLLQTLMWMAIYGTARRVVRVYQAGWTVIALPISAVAMDTLLAHLTPDGNWGSLAYTQAEALPIVQIVSVFGLAGVLFVLMLGNSALALGLVYGLRLRNARAMFVAVALVIACTVGFGWWRLHSAGAPTQQAPVTYGMAAVDDFIAGPDSRESAEVWAQYEAQVQQLAGSGARVVLLPEKIAVLEKVDAERRKAWLADLARTNQVWLVAGLGVADSGQRRNEAWWFAPDGRLLASYLKHYLAPPERDFVAGHGYALNEIRGVHHGLAICKDMHFASFGRELGRRQVGVALVLAWDFGRDADMAANMTKLRGIESGFAIVRSSREGVLSVSDAYGRVFAAARSARLPGTTLLATVETGAPLETIYMRIGDSPGWTCVAAAIVLALSARWRERRSRIIAELNQTSAPPASSE